MMMMMVSKGPIVAVLLLIGFSCKTAEQQTTSQDASKSREITVGDHSAGFVKTSSYTPGQIEEALSRRFGTSFTFDVQDETPSKLLTNKPESVPRWSIALIPNTNPNIAIVCGFNERQDQPSSSSGGKGGSGPVTTLFSALTRTPGDCSYMQFGAGDNWATIPEPIPLRFSQLFAKIIANDGVISFTAQK